MVRSIAMYILLFLCLSLHWSHSGSFRSHLGQLYHRKDESVMTRSMSLAPPSSISSVNELLACLQSNPLRRSALEYLVQRDVADVLHPGQIKLIITALADTESEKNFQEFLETLIIRRQMSKNILFIAFHMVGKKSSLKMCSVLLNIVRKFHLAVDIDMLNKILEVYLYHQQITSTSSFLEEIQRGGFGLTRVNENTLDLVLRASTQLSSQQLVVQICRLAASSSASVTISSTERGKYPLGEGGLDMGEGEVDREEERIVVEKKKKKGYKYDKEDTDLQISEEYIIKAFQICSLDDDINSCLDLLPLLRNHNSQLTPATVDSCYAFILQTFLSSLQNSYWSQLSREQMVAQLVGGLDQGVARPLLSRQLDLHSPLLQDLLLQYLAYRNLDALLAYLSLLNLRNARVSTLVMLKLYEMLGGGIGGLDNESLYSASLKRAEDSLSEHRMLLDRLVMKCAAVPFVYTSLTSLLSPSHKQGQALHSLEQQNLQKSVEVIRGMRCELGELIRKRTRQWRLRPPSPSPTSSVKFRS